MANHLEIIIGTYEEFLLGYTIELSIKENEKYDFKQSFATHSHSASIKCVDSCGKYLASGGSDDRIIIYDMKQRNEAQILTHHESSINALRFTPDCSHLLTGGEDGKLSAIRTGSWILDKQWKKAHEGYPVQYISIHPSGKLALTIGQDLVMKTWNLVKGRLAYASNLKSKPTLGRIVNCVIWSPDGNYFTITGAKVVEVWSIATAGIVNFYECECKPLMVCWINTTKQIIGLENGKGIIYDMKNMDMTKEYKICSKRIKDIKCYNNFVFIASSSGNVTLWEYSNDSNDLAKLLNINIGCRPTCLTIIDRSKFDYQEVIKDQLINESKQLPEIQNIEKKTAVGKVEIEIENNDEIQNKNPINYHAINKKHLLENRNESKKIIKKKHLSQNIEFLGKEKINEMDNNVKKIAKLNSGDSISYNSTDSLSNIKCKKNKLNKTASSICDQKNVKNKKQRRSLS